MTGRIEAFPPRDTEGLTLNDQEMLTIVRETMNLEFIFDPGIPPRRGI